MNLKEKKKKKAMNKIFANIFIFSAPSITVLTSSPVTNGGIVTVIGVNFGPTGTPAPTVTVDDKPASSNWISDNLLSVYVPPGIGEYVPMQVTVAGQASRVYSMNYTGKNKIEKNR